jgi:uncharacterized protein YcgL (UPF0745 family)
LKIDIYQSAKCGDKYLSVAKGTRVEALILPDSIDPDLFSLSPFKTRLEVEKGKSHAAIDQDDVINQIEKVGYAMHGAKKTIELSPTLST